MTSIKLHYSSVMVAQTTGMPGVVIDRRRSRRSAAAAWDQIAFSVRRYQSARCFDLQFLKLTLIDVLNDLLRELDRQNHREILHHFSISNKRVYHDYYNPLFGSRRSSEDQVTEIRKNHPELEVEPGPLDPEEKTNQKPSPESDIPPALHRQRLHYLEIVSLGTSDMMSVF